MNHLYIYLFFSDSIPIYIITEYRVEFSVLVTVFLVVMYECASWTTKKGEHWRIDALELWYWRRLLRVPWTAKRSNQSILKEIKTKYSMEGLMPKLQWFGHLMRTAYFLEKTLMLVKIEGRKRGQQRMRWLEDITDSMDVNLGKVHEMVRDRKAWHAAVHGVTKNWTWLGDWTTTKVTIYIVFITINIALTLY